MNPFIGITLWFLIFITGGALGSLLGKKKEMLAGVVTQLVFIISSVAVFYFFGGLKLFGFCFNLYYSVVSFLATLLTAAPLTYITSKIGKKEEVKTPLDVSKMGFLEFVIVLLILAPLGEEMLFRGVLETSLLAWGICIATLIPAILFALIHIMPFKGSSLKFMVFLLTSAFILGFLAGYFRAVSNSLLPAYIVHATFNLCGKFFK